MLVLMLLLRICKETWGKQDAGADFAAAHCCTVHSGKLLSAMPQIPVLISATSRQAASCLCIVPGTDGPCVDDRALLELGFNVK